MSADSHWPQLKIADLIRESRSRGSNGSVAKKLTVRLYGRGIVASGDRGGSEATAYYRRRAGQFVYSKLDCLNGAFGVIPAHLDGYETTADLPAFDFVDGVDRDWFLKTVARPAFYGRFKFAAIGSRKANRVPTDEFLATRLSVPAISEQRAIAEVLNAMDDQVSRGEEVVRALTRSKRAVMRDLLTRGIARENKRLKSLPSKWILGRISDNVTHIPYDWDLITLTKYAKLESGHTPSRSRGDYWNGDVPWVSLSDIEEFSRLKVGNTSERATQLGIDNSSARVLPVDTVVFSRTATVGKSARMARPMATSQDFANWVCGPTILPAYLVQVFRHMDREWRRLQEGSTHQTIYMPVFQRLQILRPPVREQQEIADVGEAFDLRLEFEISVLRRLVEARTAMAQELLSGRVRVSDRMIARHRSAPDRAA